MSEQPRILAFAGSARRESLNRKLVAAAADAAREAGATVTLVELADYELPLYHGDLEGAHGLPEGARRLKRLFLDHDGLLVSCPEYNTSITPLLKNAIDWISRRENADEPALACYRGKVVALLSASPGRLGGLRGLFHVRDIFGNLGCLVLPEQKAFAEAHRLFDDDGRLKNDADRKGLERVTAALVRTVRRQFAGDGG